MSNETRRSTAVIGAIAGGAGFVAFVALMGLGGYAFSPAIFLGLVIAVIVGVALVLGLQGRGAEPAADTQRTPSHEGTAVDRTERRPGDRDRGGGPASPAQAPPAVGPDEAGRNATTPAPDIVAGTADTDVTRDRSKDAALAGAATVDPATDTPETGGAVVGSDAVVPPGAAGATDGGGERDHFPELDPAVHSTSPEPDQRASHSPVAVAAPGWTSSQLKGEQELASRKGNWRYVRKPGEPGDPDLAPGKPSPAAEEIVDIGTEPPRLHQPREGGSDDLKKIKGVGPKLEAMLNRMGFYHFDQVAEWSDQEVAWVDENLKGFKGRVSRDNWVSQAGILAEGGETDFSRRVGGGRVS